MLGLAEVDAVFISSPDHWHAAHLEAATKAGKHVYVEKPMAIDIGELNRAYTAAKASGVVIQVGTQLRSTPIAMGCRELVKSGKLGRISRIEQVRNGERPYWYEYLKPDVRAEDLDWNTFTKGRTKKAFDPILYSGWYGYWEFSQGPVPQWAVHFLDTAHFIAGLGIPETCVCLGGVYTWKDEHAFTAPDQVQALWQLPGGADDQLHDELRQQRRQRDRASAATRAHSSSAGLTPPSPRRAASIATARSVARTRSSRSSRPTTG